MSTMTDQEFKIELRRHLIALIKLCLVYYGMTWLEFMPSDVQLRRTSEVDKQPLVIT